MSFEYAIFKPRMHSWILENCNYELNGEATPDWFDERSFNICELDDLLDMAVVGIGHNTSFYCLCAGKYNGMNSDVPGYQREFLRDGFFQLCIDLAGNEGKYHDGTTIKDHCDAFAVVNEFLMALIGFMQDLEIIDLQNPQAAS